MTMTRKGPLDYLKGLGMISSGDGSAAYYVVTGIARGTENFGENVTGHIVYSKKCTGHLGPLSNLKATFQTIVDSKGFALKSGRIQTKRPPERKESDLSDKSSLKTIA